MKKIYSMFTLLLLTAVAFAQTPTQLFDIYPGFEEDGDPNQSAPNNLFVFGDQVFFGADDASGSLTDGEDAGRELYATNGSELNFVKDIRPGSGAGSSPFNFFVLNNQLYFTANDGASELWTSDGTEEGTTKVDLFPARNGDVPNNAVVAGDIAYLTVNLDNGNNQLASFDGTDAQVLPNVIDGEIVAATAVTFYNDLVFAYMETNLQEEELGRELYSYNPATSTYSLVKDIATGDANSGISNFTIANDMLYFEAQGNLWQSDGTSDGTVENPAAASLGMNGTSNYFEYNGDVLFEGDTGAGDQLWILDTETGIITQLSNNSGEFQDHNPSDYVVYNNAVYYAGTANNDGERNLYRTNGAEIRKIDGTVDDVDDLVVLGDQIIFEGNNGDGRELFSFNAATASIERFENGAITLYPNPSIDGEIRFTGTVSNDMNYNVYDLSGRSVQSGEINNASIKHNLKTGVYFVSVSNSEISKTIKFAVK
ncbi:T9SS type A sorting domain-containing protein [Nonlabens ponticola]|uniref:T9SS type A sorting domain-containing protein n=1 Tax=Nonlabens ponticola TaxID=2496866 RepID=A0A3S9MXV3_9FLAO|nr:T9SS type A sorting domain-containing protein [Nonlabens ponticola]AZQ43962.1 T9SS type A sorting domain-containing protein [Nonlabens ponticola]